MKKRGYLVYVLCLLLLVTSLVVRANDYNVVEQGSPPNDEPNNQASDLPIDIAAIGRTVQPGVVLSLRFFELDLFSENSQRVNNAISEQLQFNRATMEDGLFQDFDAIRVVDVNAQIFNTTQNLHLFVEPTNFRGTVHAEHNDAISVWIIVSVMLSFAVLGYFIARVIILKGERVSVHNIDN